jgi:hypothetical protein
MVLRHCGSIYDQVGVLVRLCRIVLEMDRHPFCLQFLCEGGGCFIIPAYPHPPGMEIPRKGTHADATDTNKVYRPDPIEGRNSCRFMNRFCHSAPVFL